MVFLAIVGFVVVLAVAALTLIHNSEIGSIGQGAGFICTVFGFGFIYANDDTILKDNCNRMRKTESKNLFINAPVWFNKYVVNVGGVKK